MWGVFMVCAQQLILVASIRGGSNSVTWKMLANAIQCHLLKVHTNNKEPNEIIEGLHLASDYKSNKQLKTIENQFNDIDKYQAKTKLENFYQQRAFLKTRNFNLVMQN